MQQYKKALGVISTQEQTKINSDYSIHDFEFRVKYSYEVLCLLEEARKASERKLEWLIQELKAEGGAMSIVQKLECIRNERFGCYV